MILLGKDDGFREWRENLKGVLKKTSLTVNQNVLFLYDTQMMADDRYVEVYSKYFQEISKKSIPYGVHKNFNYI